MGLFKTKQGNEYEINFKDFKDFFSKEQKEVIEMLFVKDINKVLYRFIKESSSSTHTGLFELLFCVNEMNKSEELFEMFVKETKDFESQKELKIINRFFQVDIFDFVNIKFFVGIL